MKSSWFPVLIVATLLPQPAFGGLKIQELELRVDPEVLAVRPYDQVVVQLRAYSTIKNEEGEEERVRLRFTSAEFQIREEEGGWLSKPFIFQGEDTEPFHKEKGSGFLDSLLGFANDEFLVQDSVLYTAPPGEGTYTLEARTEGISTSVTLRVDSKVESLKPAEKAQFGVEGPDRSSYRALAEHYAPFVAQATWFSPKADYLARFDYDGDWKGDNNWESLDSGSSQAYVHYSAVETETHWFLIYDLFHPRDYSDKCVAGTCHENDSEGLILTVRKDGSPFGRLQVMETLAHNNIYSFKHDSSIRNKVHSIDGKVSLFEGSHPMVFVESGGHGVYGVSSRHSKYDIKKDQFLIGTGVTYVFKGKAEKPRHPDQRLVGYQLLPIFDQWWVRSKKEAQESEAFDDYFSYQPYGRRPAAAESPISGAFLGRKFGKNKAKPFWGWQDRRTSKKKVLAPGQWGLDPAYSVSKNLRFPKPFSVNYLFNPYLSLPAR
jgi:hypothetical protein